MPPDWPSFQFKFYQFEPRPMPEAIDEGFPSIYLGRALDFLIGEDFQGPGTGVTGGQ
jgi:predicted YcjX-like family ATPase